MDLNKVEVYICGKKLTLKTKESSEYIKGLARIVDQKFAEAFALDSALSLFDASVLVSMQLMDELNDSRESLDNIRLQIKSYAEESEKFRVQLERYQKLEEDWKEQNEKLQYEIDMLSLQKKLQKMNEQQSD